MKSRSRHALGFAGGLVAGTCATVLFLKGALSFDANLFDGSLLTGWSLILVLAALCACVWTPRRNLSALGVQLRWLTILTAFASIVFALHIHSFPPNGILDQILAWTFVALLVCSGWGYRISLALEEDPTRKQHGRLRTWLYFQAMVLGLLLGGGGIHGLLVHTHGMMAGALEG